MPLTFDKFSKLTKAYDQHPDDAEKILAMIAGVCRAAGDMAAVLQGAHLKALSGQEMADELNMAMGHALQCLARAAECLPVGSLQNVAALHLEGLHTHALRTKLPNHAVKVN